MIDSAPLASVPSVGAASAGVPLAGATAVVTGASRGIGEAVARALAGAGARVALVARNRAALDQLAAAIGTGATAISCDLTDAGAVERAVSTIETTFAGPPRILVNNAGIFRVAPVRALAVGDLEAMVELNLVTPFRFTRAFLPAMIKAGSGHIVSIGSVADRSLYPGNAGYSASKFGARAVHEVLRAETKGTGVRATLVSPGATDTQIWDGLDPKTREAFPARSAMLDPGDVARAVIYAVTQPPAVNVDELRLTRS